MLSSFYTVTLSFQVLLISVNCNFYNHSVGGLKSETDFLFSIININKSKENKILIITDSRLLYNVELFKRVTNEPKNYTIIFKYRADCTTGRPTFLEMKDIEVIRYINYLRHFEHTFIFAEHASHHH